MENFSGEVGIGTESEGDEGFDYFFGFEDAGEVVIPHDEEVLCELDYFALLFGVVGLVFPAVVFLHPLFDIPLPHIVLQTHPILNIRH